MGEINIYPLGGGQPTVIQVAPGTPLAEALRQAGAPFSFPCGGRRTCGKCVLWAKGDFGAISPGEARLLTDAPAQTAPAPGFSRRLACFCQTNGAGDLILPADPLAVPAQSLPGAATPAPIPASAATPANQAPQTQPPGSAAPVTPPGSAAQAQAPAAPAAPAQAPAALAALAQAPAAPAAQAAQATPAVSAQAPAQAPAQAAPGPFTADGLPAYDGDRPDALGVAVDIGTTTITAVLFDLPAGAALATAHEMSRQRSYGADVLSRIAYANQNGHLAVGAPLVGQLGDMLRQTLTQAAQKAESVQRLVITGNTTMLHFLTGLDPRGIGAAPFTPQSLFGDSRPAQALFPFLPPEAELYLPPCVSAYIGADITCGILSTDLCRRQETGLLVDVGTNGEMALYADGLLLCCAAAAGPAFEGAEIRMGMSAAAGAIDKLWATEKGAIEWRVIGGGPPAGLCGTGLISAAALLLRQGIMDGGGRLQTAGHPYTEYLSRRDGQIVFQLGDSGVLLTQRDIRNLQLAKAAIRAGLETLLPDAGKTAADIRRLYLAGGFGSFLDPGEAAQIGLIPTALGSKTTAVGNAALTGAARLLFSQSARDEAGRLAAQAREISLTTSQVFMSRYIEQMSFRDE